MLIGIVVERAPGETRVAATPSTVAQLIQLGYEVVVERGAGAGSSFPDADYEQAGGRVVTKKAAWAADIVLTVNAPSDAELGTLAKGAVLISWLSPALNPDLVDRLVALPITALAMDACRASRARRRWMRCRRWPTSPATAR